MKPCIHVPNQPCVCGGQSVCAHQTGSYYPVMLDLRGKKVLFVGGGWETEHKVRGLLEAGALVTLISPEAHIELKATSNKQQALTHLKREYQTGDLEGFLLVVSHPADKSLNGEVAQEARERGIWINAVDDPQYCDFILPSVYRQGDLVISVSTSGKAPAVGIRIKQKIAGMFGSEYAQYLHLLGLLRHEVSRAFPEDFAARKAAWYRMVDCGALGLVRIGEPEAARQTLLNALHDISDPVGTSRSPLQTAQIKEVVR